MTSHLNRRALSEQNTFLQSLDEVLSKDLLSPTELQCLLASSVSHMKFQIEYVTKLSNVHVLPLQKHLA